jgi:hypothetical protein
MKTETKEIVIGIAIAVVLGIAIAVVFFVLIFGASLGVIGIVETFLQSLTR